MSSKTVDSCKFFWFLYILYIFSRLMAYNLQLVRFMLGVSFSFVFFS